MSYVICPKIKHRYIEGGECLDGDEDEQKQRAGRRGSEERLERELRVESDRESDKGEP